MWSKTYKGIYVELHKTDREYIVLISYGKITENSEDWFDRAEVVKTDRKYLLIIKKEMACNLPKDDEDINKGIKLECDMIIYLPLPEDAYKVDKWRVGNGVMEVWISRINS